MEPSKPNNSEQNTGDIATEQISDKARFAFKATLNSAVLRQLVLWGITLVTARILNPADYGMMALAETVIPYIALLSTLEIANWISQRDSFSQQERAEMFSFSLLLGAVAACATYFLAPLVASFYGSQDLVSILRLLSVIFILQGFALVPFSVLRRELEFKMLARLYLFSGIARGLLQLALALAGFGFWSLVYGLLFEWVVASIVICYLGGMPKRLAWNFGLYREALRFGIPAAGAVVLAVIFSTADDVVIGKFLGIEVLGFYSMAFYLTDLPLSKINSVVSPILVPYLSKLRDSKEKLSAAVLGVMKGTTTLTTPALLGLAVVAELAVSLVLGEKWLPMALPLQVLCVVVALRASTDCIPNVFLSLGKPQLSFQFHLVCALALAPCFLILVQRYGLEGIYATWLFIYPVVLLYGVSKLTGLTTISFASFFANLRAPFISSFVMLAACLAIMQLTVGFSELLQLVLIVAVGALTYGITYYFVFPRETAMLRSEISSIIHSEE